MSVTSLLHDEGENIVVSFRYINEDGTKGGWSARMFTSLKTAEEFAAKKNRQRANVYIKHGVHDGVMFNHYKPLQKADNFTGSRTFMVDVDCGLGKPYATLKEAVQASGMAFKALAGINLPGPNLVLQTGGGMHYCWVLDKVIAKKEWEELNKRFLAFLRNAGLKLDTGCDTINEGVRADGENMHNYNHGASIPIKNLREQPRYLADPFIHILNEQRIRAVGPTKAERDESEFDEYRVYQEHKFDLAVAVDNCKMLKDTIERGGVGDYEPQWWDKLLLVAKASDRGYAIEVAHAISNKHPSYGDGVETDQRFLRALESEVKAYVTCKRFESHPNSVCHTCAFRGKVNSPAGIARFVKGPSNAAPLLAASPESVTPGVGPATVSPAVANANSPDGLPSNLYYNSENGLRRVRMGDDSPDVCIWSNVNVYDVRLTKEDGGSSLFLEFKFQSRNGTQISIPVSQIPDGRALANYMAKRYNILLAEGQRKGLHTAMTSWIENLRKRQSVQALPKHYTGMGWSSDYSAFTVGSDVFNADGTKTNMYTDDELSKFNPKGTAQAQIAILNNLFINETRPEAHAMLATSLAAPLLKLVGCQGICLNFYSGRSGYGKTTILTAASSVWGLPDASIIGVDDTTNAVIHRMTTLNNLPGYFDELRVSDPQAYLRTLVFRMAQGIEKRRLNSDSSMQHSGRWQTMMVFATNFSFAGLINGKMGQGDAGNARFIDFNLPPLPAKIVPNAINVGIANDDLKRNHGHIGRLFASYIVQNRDSVSALLTQISNKLLILAQTAPDDTSGRNHVLASACLMVAAIIAEGQGLLPVKKDLVMQAIVNAIKSGKKDRREAQETINPDNILNEYLKVNEGDRVVTEVSGKLRKVLIGPRNSRGHVGYEICRAEKQILIDHMHFCAWLREQGFNAAEVLGGLAKYNKGERHPLAKGTELATSHRRVIVVPINVDDPNDPYRPLLGLT